VAPDVERREGRARLVATSKRFGLAVDPDARVARLSVGERQRVEILKALYRDARVLILDEPTAVLTPQESEALFATLRGLCADGLSIIFISHKLDEVLRVSDRSRGAARRQAGRDAARLGHREVDARRVMVGRPIPPPVATAARKGDTVCVLDHVVVRGERAGERLDDVSLSLRSGEITAIAGVSGNGQAALVDVLCGCAPPTPDGQARRPRACADPAAWSRQAAARIPEDSARRRDRRAAGVGERDRRALPQAVSRAPASCAAPRRRTRYARTLRDRYDVRGAGIDAPAARAVRAATCRSSSSAARCPGGAARRPVPAACCRREPADLGLDVAARSRVSPAAARHCARGAAVLLVSEDLDEILALADRIAVMHAGRLTPARAASSWTLAEIGSRDGGRRGARCGLRRAARCRRRSRSPRRSPRSPARSSSPRCSSRGPARRSGAPTR
jgi:simple sugar transport system ATP-binding protein